MRFFFDQNLSHHLSDGLNAFGENVVHLRDHFPQDVDDTTWLKFVGQNNLTVITRDKRLRWNPAELAAFRRFKVGAFFLAGKELNRCKMIQMLIRHWPKIKKYASTTSRPFAFTIPPSGTQFRRINL
jgi:hypothetical protein